MSYNKIEKNKLDYYLNELAKEYHKLGRKSKGEIILIGGAAVIANYDFRCMSEDADSIIYAESHLKEAILKVARDNNLPDNWLNQDFVQTRSYSDKIAKYAKDYKTFAYSITFRIIDREYLIAMKLASFRKYKNDISDIIGILKAEHEKGNEIYLEQIKQAIINLYGEYNYIGDEAIAFIEKSMQNKTYLTMYDDVIDDEQLGRNIYMELKNEMYITEQNINDVLLKTKQLRLIELYKNLSIKPSDDMHENASLAQKVLEEKGLIAKEYFGDLYLLHSQYLNK